MLLFRLTYAFNREDPVYTTLINAFSISDAFNRAKIYIEDEHGINSFSTLIAISFIEQVESKGDN